ncbi:MAG: ParA family protein [Pseudonocardiaceae bacterium]
MPAEIIAVANHKGGVGKSFTAVSLASGMAHAGWRTLLVDCDAQANATSMFDPDDQVEFDLLDVIVNGVEVAKAVITTRVPGLDLLGASLDVARLDQELITRHYREEQVRRALAPLLENYDVMVLDLSPNLGQLVITALNAATGLIVPTDASRWGHRGVAMFLEWAEELRRADVLRAELLGVVLTKYEAGTRISREVRDGLQAGPWPMFNTLIPKRVAAERMVAELRVVGDPEADLDLSQAYANLTAEVLERLTASIARRGRHARG